MGGAADHQFLIMADNILVWTLRDGNKIIEATSYCHEYIQGPSRKFGQKKLDMDSYGKAFEFASGGNDISQMSLGITKLS